MGQPPKRKSNAPAVVLVLVVMFGLPIGAYLWGQAFPVSGSGGNGGCVTVYDRNGPWEDC